ncbi:MAG: DUF4097 family beta strand repeat protein [Clostridiales bacterium]|nr:DUF4097 family beta strand repeat protein [Clostridiales bacterium]
MDNYGRVKILKMLEDGKISSEDALKLMEVIDEKSEKIIEPIKLKSNSHQKANIENHADAIEAEANLLEDEADKLEQEAYEVEKQADEMETKADELEEETAGKIREEADEIRKNADRLREKADEIREKADEKIDEIEELRDSLEEKFKELNEKTEKLTSEIGEKVNKKLKDINFSRIFEGGFFKFGFEVGEGEEVKKEINIKVNEDISVTNRNGSIKLNITKEQPYVIFTIRSKHDVDMVMDDIIFKNDNKLIIDATFDGKENTHNRTKVSIEVFLPEIVLGEIIAKTTNGRVEIGNISGNSIQCKSTNGRLNIYDLTGKNIVAKSTNGQIICYRTSSDDLKASTTNGGVKAGKNDSKIQLFKTTNGSVNAHDNKGDEIILKTTNGSIKSYRNLATIHNALTTNAGIAISEFSPKNEKANVILKTSNGSVSVTNREDVKIDFSASLGKNKKISGDFSKYHQNGKEHIGTVKRGSDSTTRVFMQIKTSMGNISFK